jgi:hypothetical protein
VDVTNPSSTDVNVRTTQGGTGGGPEGWRTLRPGETHRFDLSPNVAWRLECCLAPTAKIYSIEVQPTDHIELTMAGRRLSPRILPSTKGHRQKVAV